METVQKPALIAEGKTKKIFDYRDRYGLPSLVKIFSKDDISAGDGARHDVIEGKGALVTQMTCDIFELLREWVPLAFVARKGPTTFIASKCRMLPYEVIVRREAHGSFLQRRPDLTKGHRFDDLVVEFDLKTSGRRWPTQPDVELACDDPLMVRDATHGVIRLFDTHKPIEDQKPFHVMLDEHVFTYPFEDRFFELMAAQATKAFHVLEVAFDILGYRYVDYKVEFGINPQGKIVLADVIDNDSGRLIDTEGNYVDKQRYRDGEDPTSVKKLYALVAHLTSRFHQIKAEVHSRLENEAQA